jgi:hypothetical protein
MFRPVSSELWAAFAGAVLGGLVSIATSVVMELWKARRSARTATILFFEAVTRATIQIEAQDSPEKARVASVGARSVASAWGLYREALIGGSTFSELGGLVGRINALEELATLGETRVMAADAGEVYAGSVLRFLEEFGEELRSRGSR